MEFGLLLVAVCLVLLWVPSVAADVFDGAEWLRDPVFDGVDTIDVFHKEKAERPKLSGPKNVHTYFRKEIELPAEPTRALLHITADDYCKLYINGEFVVQGPEAGYPFAHNLLSLDVTGHLTSGKNCLAAHVYYQGLLNRVWNSADNRSGFMLTLDVTFPDGQSAQFVTDPTWRCLQSEAFPTNRTIGYKTQFGEDIDMRAIPKGWREAGFDDQTWQQPLVGRQDHVFVEQITPPLEHWRADPQRVVEKGDGHYFYDFGEEIVGHTRIRLEGTDGHVIEVRHGEELSGPDTVRYEMRANCLYQEFPALAEGDNLIEFYDYKGFRYVEVLDAQSEPEVWVDVRHHPFDPSASSFTASDDLLARIWELCKNGVQFGSQGGFLDCPTREKGQYLGDALHTGRAHLLLTADGTLTKKAIHDFQLSQRICPGLMAVAPGSLMQEIAEYSLQWPMVLNNYYQQTGDTAFVEAMADKVFAGLLNYFARFETPDGLIAGINEKWVLVDWPQNLRDDYDYDYALSRENAVLNAFYYESLRCAGALLNDLERDGGSYLEKAARVKDAFVARLLDPETGLFVDAPGSKHSSLHANALPLAFGMAPPETVPGIVDMIREKRLSCGVYIAPFVIEACYRAGESELAYSLLTSTDEHSWHEMLKHGATTCIEAWGPDQKWNTSWCHPWSCGPIFLIAEYVMGLSPAEPGWRSIRFAPHVSSSLDTAALTIPIPQGRASVRYERETSYRVTVPPGVSVETDDPDDVPVEVVQTLSHAKGVLSDAQRAFLEEHGWRERVGDGLGVWVSVPDQAMYLIRCGEVVWQAACSTAVKGTGNVVDSFQTPLGWHSIAGKAGADAPWGQVFRSGKPTSEIWRPGDETKEDLVLTRILFLAGEEPGENKGGNVDSFARYIYIHGTPAESLIGTPASHGCIRLRNDDVIEAFDLIPEGTPVLISE